MLVHSVFFTLRDGSPEARRRLVAACETYLKPHPGVLWFACGTRDPELERPVNDQAFDVALHVAFEDRAAHDRYQEAELHQRFIAEQQENWAQVRVFDAEC